MTAKQERREYLAMADFLDDTDFDFSAASQKEYNALAAEAIAAGFVRGTA
jgi:hypothetical protein